MQQFVYDRMEKIEAATGKKLLGIPDVAGYMQMPENIVYELVVDGLIKTVGNSLIRTIDLAQFEVGALEDVADVNNCGNMLFSEFFESYLATLAGGIRVRSYKSQLDAAKHIIEGLGNAKMSEITPVFLKSFINGFALKKYSKGEKEYYYSTSMIHKVYILLSSAIRDAAENGMLPRNYMIGIKEPRSNQFNEVTEQALTDEEIHMILDAVSDHPFLNTWIHILLYTGMRPSEALALTVDDINFKNRTIRINKTLSFSQELDEVTKEPCGKRFPIITDLKNYRENGRTNYQIRTLITSDKIMRIVKTWLNHVASKPKILKQKKAAGTEGFLFCGQHGYLTLYDNYAQMYQRHLRKRGIDPSVFNLYRFRHNYCTRLLRLEQDVKTVQMIMGDNDATMILRVYANMNQEDVTNGCNTFNDYMDYTLQQCNI